MKKIVLADSQPLFRVGMASTLVSQKDNRIVAQCGEPERMIQILNGYPGCILLAASSLLSNTPAISTLLSLKCSKGIVVAENQESAARFLRNKFHGVIFRDVSTPVLLECVQQVASGKVWEPREPAMSHAPDQGEGDRLRSRLTPKEMRIISLVIQGNKNREIAAHVKLSTQVVKNYLRSIYDKTGASTRMELMLLTMQNKRFASAVSDAGMEIFAETNGARCLVDKGNYRSLLDERLNRCAALSATRPASS